MQSQIDPSPRPGIGRGASVSASVTTHYRTIRGKVEPQLTGKPPPANIVPSLQTWIGTFCWIGDPMGGPPDLNTEVLRGLERKLGVSVPFYQLSGHDAVDDLLHRVSLSEDFAVRAVAILLPDASGSEVVELAEIFESPGSRWEVVFIEDGNGRLTLRQSGPISDVVDGLAGFAVPAHAHLEKALEKLTRPGDRDPSGAYLEAVKAVEAAARPVVIPTDPLATLGKIVAALEAKPSKWAVVLDTETVEDVTRRAAILWTTPHERHGSNEPAPPVTVEKAQAGFDLALGLVDYFARGLIYRVEAGDPPPADD